jgi:hypothetical protein
MTDWFTMQAGGLVHPHEEDPSMILIDMGVPDWVRLPPGLGGHQCKVVSAENTTCVGCGDHNVRHLKLDVGVRVCECPERGFLWYTLRSDEA